MLFSNALGLRYPTYFEWLSCDSNSIRYSIVTFSIEKPVIFRYRFLSGQKLSLLLRLSSSSLSHFSDYSERRKQNLRSLLPWEITWLFLRSVPKKNKFYISQSSKLQHSARTFLLAGWQSKKCSPGGLRRNTIVSEAARRWNSAENGWISDVSLLITYQ